MESTMFYGAKKQIFQNAKELRDNMTKTEKLLWDRLKGNKLGVCFKSQHPISQFIADFYCHKYKLVIEIDGSVHDLQKDYDECREDEMRKFRITTIRFTNEDILENIDNVIEKIKSKISSAPKSPAPKSPEGDFKTPFRAGAKTTPKSPEEDFKTPFRVGVKFILTIILLIGINNYNLKAQFQFSNQFPGMTTGNFNCRDFLNVGDSTLYISGLTSINGETIYGLVKWHFPNGNFGTFNSYIYLLSGGGYAVRIYKDTLYVGNHCVGSWFDAEYFSDGICSKEKINLTPIHNDNDLYTMPNSCYDPNYPNIGTVPPIGEIWAICEYDGKLFLGSKTMASFRVISYDSRIGRYVEEGNNCGTPIHCLKVFNMEVYGGGVSMTGNTFIKYRGNGRWQTFPNNIKPRGDVRTMSVDTFNTFLYISGDFDTIGFRPSLYSPRVAMWDGFKWNRPLYYDIEIGENLYFVAAGKMTVVNGDLYINSGLSYYDYGADRYRSIGVYLSRWNGERLDTLGKLFNIGFSAFTVFKDTLYMGGEFTHYNNQELAVKGLMKMSLPPRGCNYIKPRIYSTTDQINLNTIPEREDKDTFNVRQQIQFINNNPYVDSWHWSFGDNSPEDQNNFIKEPQHSYTAPGTYQVNISVTHQGCTRSHTKTIIIKDTIISIPNPKSEFENLYIKLYPNPTTGDFTFETNLENFKNAEISIISQLGSNMITIPILSNKTIIHTDGWKNGIYHCNLLINSEIIKSGKIILER